MVKLSGISILWIKTTRTKTEIEANVPLIPQAVEILKKYDVHPCRDLENKLLPVKSTQKMNAYLKEIANLAGINKNLTTHIARHTFATTVTLMMCHWKPSVKCLGIQNSQLLKYTPELKTER
jgi:integrase